MIANSSLFKEIHFSNINGVLIVIIFYDIVELWRCRFNARVFTRYFGCKEMWEAKSDWVHSIIKADFPKQMEKFRLAVDTQ